MAKSETNPVASSWEGFEATIERIRKLISESPGFQKEREGRETFLKRLKEQGIEIEVTCGAAPFQLEGRLPTGEPIYYRVRHGSARLDVGPKGTTFNWDGKDTYVFRQKAMVSDDMYFGWYEEGITDKAFFELLEEYRNYQK